MLCRSYKSSPTWLRADIFRTIQKLAHRRISEAHERSNKDDDDNDNHDLSSPSPTNTAPRLVVQGVDQSKKSTLYTIPASPAPEDTSTSRTDQDEQEEDSGVEEGAYLKSKLWWIGLAMISIGEGGNFLSYAFAPASVVAPLGTVVGLHSVKRYPYANPQALVANCIFAPIILKERFRPRELIGMGLAILGAVTVVYSSEDTNPRVSKPHVPG